jgi:AcrR family transcriptional regulator
MAIAAPARARMQGQSSAEDDRPTAKRARGGVADIQRARMIAAMAQVARERGIGATTVADVVARSGVSRRTFYELFADRDDCFCAAFDHAIARASRRVLPAYESAVGWRERMRAGLSAALEFLEDDPDLGALCVVDALGAGPVALARRREVMRSLIEAVDEGREEARASAKPTSLTAEGVVGAVLAVLHERLSSASLDAGRSGGRRVRHATCDDDAGDRDVRAQAMIDLLGPLMAMVVLPYQGQAAAAREAARSSPRRRASAPRSSDPLQALDMRLTYRTVQVLCAIAQLSGREVAPSNRQVGDAAGISDQGQISKLLARLEHLGLIRNDVRGPYRGEPNAWSLTATGAEIERTILRAGHSVAE